MRRWKRRAQALGHELDRVLIMNAQLIAQIGRLEAELDTMRRTK